MEQAQERWELLTESETEFLQPIVSIINEINTKYKYINTGRKTEEEINELLNNDFRVLCKKKNIDTKQAAVISKKLFTTPWYCYYITDVESKNGSWQDVFSLCTSKDTSKETVLNYEEYKDFYTAVFSTDPDPDTAYPAILDGLHLTHDYKYISPDFYEALASIAEVYTDQGNNILKPRDIAREQGALQTINSRLSFASEKELDRIFTGYHVKLLPPGNKQTDIINIEDPKNIKEVFDINPGIMGAILKMALMTFMDGAEDSTVKFQVTPICRELNIDYRPYSSKRTKNAVEIADQKQMEKQRNEQRMTVLANNLRPFESYMILLNGVYYRMMFIESYDPQSDVMTVRAPAFFRILENISSRTPQHGQFNYYFHGSVANEENTAAVEVAQYLGNKLLQMGNKSPYKAKYATIIQNNPQLKQELEAITNHGPTVKHEDGTETKYNKTQIYNVTLKRILETAYRIILEKSDFPLAFIDFKINGVSKWEDPKLSKGDRRIASAKFKIPTKTRLGDVLTISHKGKNTHYIRPEKL